ncbi:hypothetical protein [Cohnella nanjingensis]|uniref:Uncharacterized protein n=1 Tax=Cohnella nanjingensis TaxID=1387779 RepID=A0A7X0RZA6_9BACL|nr:hypothetical protein [Cohnella nanjingensis]MBB6675226.1 hypothetical protein [Cohnella nanjingensis]
MDRFGDGLVFVVALVLIGWWIWRRFDNWLHEPPSSRLRKLAQAGEVEPDEAVDFLQEHGYSVLSGKHRVPLGVIVDDGPVQTTRLYFDYFAAKEDRYYLVRLERSRQPIDWTASGLRERLLPYALLFPECDGIIVADPKDRLLRTVRFRVEDEKA